MSVCLCSYPKLLIFLDRPLDGGGGTASELSANSDDCGIPSLSTHEHRYDHKASSRWITSSTIMAVLLPRAWLTLSPTRNLLDTKWLLLNSTQNTHYYIAEVENESRVEISPFPLGSIVRHKFGGVKMLIVDLNGKGHYTAAFASPHTGLITEILFAEGSLERADVMSS